MDEVHPLPTNARIRSDSNSEIKSNNRSLGTSPKQASIKSRPLSFMSENMMEPYIPASPRNSTLPNLTEIETAKVVKKHLVTNDDTEFLNLSPTLSIGNADDEFKSSHHLQGGYLTRDIYKWTQDVESTSKLRRSSSFHNLNDAEEAQNLLLPGAFRRNFVIRKAMKEGRNKPNFLTNNFLDFLSLYGHFAGDYYPPDDEDEEEEELEADESIGLTAGDSKQSAKASQRKVFFLLMKSFVGTGVLFLPRSFYDGGILFSAITVGTIAYLSLYCMLLLVECHHIVGGGFGDIGKKLYGKYARYFVLISIVCSQLGFCCAYTIFISKNLRQLFLTLLECKYQPPQAIYIFVQLLIYIPMSMVRKIKYFSLAALIADVFILGGLGYIYYFSIEKLFTVGPAPINMFNPNDYFLMIGTAVFTFEGIGLVLPIAESIKTPKEFPAALNLTVLLSAVIFISVASLCYAVFGSSVNPVVLLNFPRDSKTVQSVQFFYSLAIIFSVPLQLFPVIKIFENGLFPRSSGKSTPMIKWKKNIFRSGLAIFFSCVSYFEMEKLDRIVGLVGAFACVPLCFIYPSIFHYKAIKDIDSCKLENSEIPIRHGRAQEIKDLMLFVFGIVAMFVVTFIIILTWNESSPPEIEICT